MSPSRACEGGRVKLHGTQFPVGTTLPEVRIGDRVVRLAAASPSTLTFIVPSGLDGGRMPIRVAEIAGEAVFLEVGRPVATGLHQVDSPAFDSAGRLYLTYSGARGQQVPVSIFRVTAGGARESFVSGIVNPTSMAFAADGRLYVSSRFEGSVYRVADDGAATPVVTDVGVACGLAFGRDGTLYIGDRSGTVFRVLAGGQAAMLAALPPSVAAFHVAMGPDDCLYVTAPTLTSYDHVYRIWLDGRVEVAWSGFGRPQGLAFDAEGTLYVTEALAGSSGLYRLSHGRPPELVIAGEGLVGVAFDPRGGCVVASNETAYRFDAAPMIGIAAPARA